MPRTDCGNTLDQDLAAALERRRSAGLYRHARTVEPGGAPPWQMVDGRRCLGFSSNDYLGLARDPRISAALAKAAGTWGTGAGAAHLAGGHTRAHAELEEQLADWTGRPRALLFSTGYMANLGALAALAGRGDLVLEDRLNHASLIDAARLTGARVRRYAHADPDALARRLDAADNGATFVVTDGVFSMDGDEAPLGRIAAICERAGACLMVDDAHGLGVVGTEGRGLTDGLSMDRVPVLVGTLGKALGGFGAFVAGSESLVETLIQKARPWIYTTAPPPAVAAAVSEAVRIARTEAWRRQRLTEHVRRFREGAAALGLNLPPSRTPIQPVILGAAEAATRASESLFDAGIWVAAIRPPTVPDGTARLRISLSAAHEDEHIDRLLEGLARLRTPAVPR
jgi:8-amino-7-oxononanoate synthase